MGGRLSINLRRRPSTTPPSTPPNPSSPPPPPPPRIPTPSAHSTSQATANLAESSVPSFYLWYWMDNDGSWKSYDGSSGFISSDTIEQSYQNDSRGRHAFSLKGSSYVIDFVANTQTNTATGQRRKVKRQRCDHYDWYWQNDNGQWKKYDSTVCGVTSAEITARFYDSNAVGYRFVENGFPYVIDFKNMIQKNETTGKSRKVKRELSTKAPSVVGKKVPVQTSSNDWYWQGDDETWHLFNGTINSDYIEAKFKANPNDRFTFDLAGRSYSIDLHTMTQTNQQNGKLRRIARTPKGVAPPSARKNNPKTNDYIRIGKGKLN